MKNILFTVFWAVVILFLISTVPHKLYLIATTDPPYKYMVDDLSEQIKCAQRAGLIGYSFQPPTLRIMRPAYEPNRPDGFAYMELNIVTLAGYASYDTIGHELGHIIDYQTSRKGHPLLEQNKDLPDQAFANAMRDIIIHECSLSK